MLLVNPLKTSNRFKPVPIMSNRKLFERFGFSLGRDGHPDNTDPTKFSEPSNSKTHNLTSIQNQIDSYIDDIENFARSQKQEESGSIEPDPEIVKND